ncbi:dihydrofolate reductase family protein [bacterium]|nr:dihydrofolate reductase family protein [bacterium]
MNKSERLKVTLIMVMSANGIVAQKKTENSFEWSSVSDKKQFLNRIREIGTVIMGGNTFRAIKQEPYEGVRFFVLSRRPYRFQPNKNVEFIRGDILQVYKELCDKGIRQVALLGGPETNAQFFNHGLIDNLYLTIEPLLLPKGLQFVSQLDMKTDLVLNEMKVLDNSNSILLHYSVRK